MKRSPYTYLCLLTLMLAISPLHISNAATGLISKAQAYQLLKSGDNAAVNALAKGEKEILLAKLALDAGDTDAAIRILSSKAVDKNQLAALIKAEAYRRQSLAAAKRAGKYAHAISDDIKKLKKSRLNIALDAAEKRLLAFRTANSPLQLVASTAFVNKPLNEQPFNKPFSKPFNKPTTSTASSSKIANSKPKSVKTKPAAVSKAKLPDSIRSMMESWRLDWQSRNADTYLSHYHPDFISKKHDYNSWSSYKRRVNGRKKYINVTLSNLKLLRGPEKIKQGQAILVGFSQRYKSSNYAANSRKQLYLVRKHAGAAWLILHEGDINQAVPSTKIKQASKKINKQRSQIYINKKAILPANKSRGWAINIGSFDARNNARNMVLSIQLSGPQQAFVSSASVAGQQRHRVRIGLYDKRSDAVDAMLKICPTLKLTGCWLEQLK